MSQHIVSFRDKGGYVSITTYHPVQIKMAYNPRKKRWFIYTPQVRRECDDEITLIWVKQRSPYTTEDDAKRVASALLPKYLAEYNQALFSQQPQIESSDGMSVERAMDILGISREYTEAEVKARHRHLIKAVHPDTGGSIAIAKEINQAKDILMK